MMAAQCYLAGRSADFLGYAEAGQMVIESGRFEAVPYEFEAMLASAYAALGQPERWVEVCRSVIARSPGTHTLARALLAVALTFADAHDEHWRPRRAYRLPPTPPAIPMLPPSRSSLTALLAATPIPPPRMPSSSEASRSLKTAATDGPNQYLRASCRGGWSPTATPPTPSTT